MHPEIATLHDRMSQGGQWREYRDEISRLHSEAKTQEEYVALLEAFQNLRTLIPEVYDAETSDRLQAVATSEYKMFLNVEAMAGADRINPMLLDLITEREVRAGRLAADDSLRELAKAGGAVLGDTASMNVPHRRYGDWVFCGVVGTALTLAVFSVVSWSVALGVAAAGFVIGFLINDREAKRIKREIAERRLNS